MRRLFIVSFLLVFLALSLAGRPVFAQEEYEGVSRGIPGQNCGMADAPAGSPLRQCCYVKPQKSTGISVLRMANMASKFASVATVPFLGPLIPFSGPLSAVSGIFSMVSDKYLTLHESIDGFQEKYGSNEPCLNGGVPSSRDFSTPGACRCEPSEDTFKNDSKVARMCESYYKPSAHPDKADKARVTDEYSDCKTCANELGGYYSSLGCIPFKLDGVINWFVSMAVAIGGMLAMFCLMLNALRLQLSKGDTKMTQTAKQNVTSCLMGLMLILFAVLIMRIVGLTLFEGFSLI